MFNVFNWYASLGELFLIVIVGPFDALISSICILFYANLNKLFLVFVATVSAFSLLLVLMLSPSPCLYVCIICWCVCIFSLGKLDINNVQIKSSSQCRRQYWWRVLLSICTTSFFTHSSSSIYMSITSLCDGHIDKDGGWSGEECAGLCFALSRDWGNYLFNIETRVSIGDKVCCYYPQEHISHSIFGLLNFKQAEFT